MFKRAIQGIAGGALCLGLAAQGGVPVISEVNLHTAAEADSQWIELANPGTDDVQLEGWCLVHSTDANVAAPTYYWSFPSGSVLRAGGRVRVHWYGEFEAPQEFEFHTGSANVQFEFGLGGGPLSETAGGLGLIDTSDDTLVGDPDHWQDWVSWGNFGLELEGLAIASGRWLPGRYVPAPPAGASLALDLDQKPWQVDGSEPTMPEAWFHDRSPTPLAPNTLGARVDLPVGIGCSLGAVSTPRLEVLSIPVAGNSAFGIRVHGTDGTPRNQLVLLLIGEPAAEPWSIPGVLDCPLYIDPVAMRPPITRLASADQLFTDYPLPLDQVGGGLEVMVQALLVTNPFSFHDYGASAALPIHIGF